MSSDKQKLCYKNAYSNVIQTPINGYHISKYTLDLENMKNNTIQVTVTMVTDTNIKQKFNNLRTL